jgi:hypothetical protein
MNKKFRTTLFISLAILFMITAPLTVLYYMGWRFDWTTKAITQTGIFYFKVYPRESKIYIDHEFEKKTSFFFNSALIENLAPKKYFVQVKKEGFHTWEKNLEIKKREATEIKNITLIPTNPKFTVVAEIENFYPAPDNQKIVFQEIVEISAISEKGIPLKRKIWSLKLFDLEKNLKSKLIDQNDLIAQITKLGKTPLEIKNSYQENNGSEIKLTELKFSSDSKRILIETRQIDPVTEKSELRYFTLEIDKAPDSLEVIPLPNQAENIQIEAIYFSEKEFEEFLIISQSLKNEDKSKEARVINRLEENTTPPVLNNLASISIIGGDIYYIDKSGFVFKDSFSFDRKEKLNFKSFYLNPENEYEIYAQNFNVFLRDNNTLYLLDRDKKVFEKIYEPVQDLKFSQDLKKTVYHNDYELNLFFLEKVYDQPERDKHKNISLIRLSEKIDTVFWYTNHYLLLATEDTIKIIEIDNRDRVNVVGLIALEQLNPFKNAIDSEEESENLNISAKEKSPLSEKARTKVFWNQSNNKIYILFKGNLYSSEELIR